MEARYYLSCLWPGLPELWWRGRLAAAPAAVAFALAVNLLLITRYLYPQWISSGLVTVALWVGLPLWAFSVVRSVRELPTLIAPRMVSDEPDRFPEAHAAYLRAEWAEAESLLTAVLAIEPRDPPALLLLTGVYRHTDRLEAAELLLHEIKRLEAADPWTLELHAEQRRLDRALANAEESSRRDTPASESAPVDGQSSAAESSAAAAADLTDQTRSAA